MNMRLTTSPIPDHYLLYNVNITKDTPTFEGLTVGLADQFDYGQFDVTQVKNLGNPADKNGEVINDHETHYVSYEIKRTKDTPKHVKRSGVKVTNQFHEEGIFLDTITPDRLMVPSLKALGGSPGDIPEEGFPVDHFKCYRVEVTEGTPAFEPVQVSVADQFDTPLDPPRLMNVLGPKRLCNPVIKNGGEIVNYDNHLLCYEVERAEGEGMFEKIDGVIHTNNQFGPLQLDAKEEKELCVPSEKDDITNAIPITE